MSWGLVLSAGISSESKYIGAGAILPPFLYPFTLHFPTMKTIPWTTAQHVEVRLPSYWASCIINGDDSGLNENDIQLIDETLGMLNLEAVRCIDCTDENEFELAPSWAPWLLAGGYATYTFM